MLNAKLMVGTFLIGVGLGDMFQTVRAHFLKKKLKKLKKEQEALIKELYDMKNYKIDLMVKMSWLFRGDITEEQVRDFFKEYTDGEFVALNEIVYANIYDETTKQATGQKVCVAKLSTTKTNYDWFVREFGSVSTIQDHW